MTKKLLRLLWIAPLALLFASAASAQTTGTLIGVVTDQSTGKPVAGALVVATSPNLQGEQTAVTDAGGNFRISVLPPGQYKLAVQLEGYKPAERSDISLSADKTLRANLSVVPEAVQLEEQVVKTGTAPVVNVGSAEAGAVVSKEFIAAVPVARGYEAIAAVAPTAKIDTYGLSVAGAQSPENEYIIDGLNTTDPAYGTRTGRVQGGNGAFPALNSSFLQELDVKTGNFGAEYGRATGGILNVVLKGGSNEYHGSVFTNFQPDFLTQPNGVVIGPAGQAIAYQTAAKNGSYQVDYGFEVGGPIVKDQLWFYAGFSPVQSKTYYQRFLRSDVMPGAGGCPPGSSPSGLQGQCMSDSTGDYLQNRIGGTTNKLSTGNTTYQWVGKLTYLLNENNTFTVSGVGSPSSRTSLNTAFFGDQMISSPSSRIISTDAGQNSVLGRYSGKFLDKRLIAEAQAGLFATYDTPVNRTDAGVNQFNTSRIEWLDYINIADFEPSAAVSNACPDAATCPIFGYATGGRGGNFDYSSNRFAGKASLAYLFDALGAHNVKGGIDLERIEYDIKKSYTGPGGIGSYFVWEPTSATASRFRAYRGYGAIDPSVLVTDPATGIQGTSDPAGVILTRPSSKSRTNSFAYFLQDSWQLPQNITLNYGLRLETQSMENLRFPGQGFDIQNSWSPRIQGVWDFTGNGRGKVAASWGRYYYALPLDAGDRAFGAEQQVTYRLTDCPTFNGQPSATFDPSGIAYTGLNACSIINRPFSNGVAAPFRYTGAATTPVDPKLQGAFVDQFGGQAEYEILPDLSIGVDYQGRRQGNVIEDMSSNDGASYFVGNPGAARCFKDPNSPSGQSCSNVVTTVDPQTGRTLTLAMPKPERSYDGLTFKVTKIFSSNWLAQGSYTYSSLRGNYAGPYRPEDGQLDPGITSEYDLAILMTNKKGYLPADQTHQIKLFGAYTWQFGQRFNVTAGGRYTGASGMPVNALGGGANDYGPGQAFIVQRGQGGRTPFTNQFDLRGQAQYIVKAPYAVTFYLDVVNVFNAQTAQLYDENYTFDVVAPIVGEQCHSRNAAGSKNPVAALQADCPDIASLKTVDGRPVTVNSNWGKPQFSTVAYQLPISLRFGLAVSF